MQEQSSVDNYNAIVFDSTTPERVLHQFRGSTFNFGYRNVLMFMKNLNVDMNIALLSIEMPQDVPLDKEYLTELVTYLNQSRFSSDDGDDPVRDLIDSGDLTKEEAEEYYSKNKSFCHFGDFDVIWGLFLEKWGIDLTKDDIAWFKYLSLLEVLFLEENALTKRISFRQFKRNPQKGMEEFNSHGEKLKNKYSYHQE